MAATRGAEVPLLDRIKPGRGGNLARAAIRARHPELPAAVVIPRRRLPRRPGGHPQARPLCCHAAGGRPNTTWPRSSSVAQAVRQRGRLAWVRCCARRRMASRTSTASHTHPASAGTTTAATPGSPPSWASTSRRATTSGGPPPPSRTRPPSATAACSTTWSACSSLAAQRVAPRRADQLEQPRLVYLPLQGRSARRPRPRGLTNPLRLCASPNTSTTAGRRCPAHWWAFSPPARQGRGRGTLAGISCSRPPGRSPYRPWCPPALGPLGRRWGPSASSVGHRTRGRARTRASRGRPSRRTRVRRRACRR